MVKNLKQEFINPYYATEKIPVIVDMPEIKYLMIDGQGDPTVSKEFHQAMEILKKISGSMRYLLKNRPEEIDYQILPLEGLWWMNDLDYNNLSRDNWQWTLMVRQPEVVSEKMLRQIVDDLRKNNPVPVLDRLCFNRLTEGLSAQIMHLGPFASEGPTIDQLHYYIFRNGYILNGKHHEIYLSDTQNTDLHDWKTIIRQPIEIRK